MRNSQKPLNKLSGKSLTHHTSSFSIIQKENMVSVGCCHPSNLNGNKNGSLKVSSKLGVIHTLLFNSVVPVVTLKNCMEESICAESLAALS